MFFVGSVRARGSSCGLRAFCVSNGAESQGQVAVMEGMLVFFLAPDWADEKSDGGQTLEII